MSLLPSAEQLLCVWEEHQRALPVQQALGLLALVAPGAVWADAPIGLRDGELLALHERLFGAALHTTAACPRCGERLESDFSVHDIRCEAAPPVVAPLRLRHQGFDVEYRVPTSADLLQLDAGLPVDLALLRRCVTQARHGDAELDPAQLPEDVVTRITDDMARHDPAADVCIALDCPACGAGWPLRFDIVSYLWGELDDWAQRLLAEVHALASAYGWSERDVLALSPMRRRTYLDMVGA